MAALWLAAATGLAAQPPVTKTMLIEPPTQLLPQRFGNWQQQKSDPGGTSAAPSDGAAATVLKEDGLQRFAASAYQRDGSSDTVRMKAFQFADTTGAVAAYTYLRSPDSRPASQLKLGPDAALASDGKGLLFRAGSTVVQSDFNPGLRAADLAALLVSLPKPMGATALPPLLPTLLPAKGLDAESVKYAIGPAGYQATGGVLPPDAVGFDKSAETVTAKYKSGGVLTLLLYPTPTIAGDHGRAIEGAMRQQGAAAGTVMLRREGPLVALTSGGWSAAAAHSMVDGVHLHTEVSFDKPMPLEFHAEVQKTYSLLESIAIFCCFSAVAMVVIALFFGGGRALIRVMQGKPAATEPEFLHIDLRGSVGKRLRGPES